jgi:hypothetical protein
MTNIKAIRVTHEYTQTNCAPPAQVFPLLCPVREAEWVPEWRYRMIYSKSGVAEAGCIFATPNDDGSETTWIVTHYDPAAFRISFAWVTPALLAAEINIALAANESGTTRARIRYTYTGLSEAGNSVIEKYDEDWFRSKMSSWETAINHYLKTGKLITAPMWE